MLLEELISHMKKVGVKKIFTLVNWRDGNILQYFNAMGFKRGDMINLELNIEK